MKGYLCVARLTPIDSGTSEALKPIIAKALSEQE